MTGEFTNFFSSLQNTLNTYLPRILLALAVLVAGWIIAVAVRAIFKKSLHFFKLNQRLASSTGSAMDLEGGISRGAYYIVLLFTLIAFFQKLNLEIISSPLQTLLEQVFEYAPKFVAGGVLLVVAWILATVVRTISRKALERTNWDEKLTQEAGMQPVGESLSNVLYWLVFLVFLPAVLDAFQMQGLLDPVQGMVDQILGILPRLFGAAVIGIVGWFVARILRDLVTNLLGATGFDTLGKKAGFEGTLSLSRLTGLVVFIFVFIPSLIAALNALEIEVISRPATSMLESFMQAIPNIFAAAIIIGVAVILSRFIASLMENLLSGIGFNALPDKLGLGQAFKKEPSPSQLVGKIIVFFVMLFAVTEASAQLGFAQVEEIVSMFIQFGGKVLLGIIILAIGFWMANLAGTTIVRVSGKDAAPLASLAKIAILGLVLAMGLRSMGIADDIVNIAFTLTFGSVAVAIALSFGLGGREAAGKQMEYWLAKLRK